MTKVTLRQKPLKNGISQYLDYYPPIVHPETGKETRREFLNFHILKNPKTQEEKKYNTETLQTANLVKSKRELQLRNKEFGFKENVNISVDLIGFYSSLVDDYYNKGSISNYNSWKASLNHFKEFCNGIVMTNQLDTGFVNRYRNYLLNAELRRNLEEPKRISRNTASSYFKNFVSVLKLAYKRNLIEKNLG